MISAKRHMARGRVQVTGGEWALYLISRDDEASPNPIQHCELDEALTERLADAKGRGQFSDAGVAITSVDGSQA
jgi:hypothetical protein